LPVGDEVMAVIESKKKQRMPHDKTYIFNELQEMYYKLDEILQRVQMLEKHCFNETYEARVERTKKFN